MSKAGVSAAATDGKAHRNGTHRSATHKNGFVNPAKAADQALKTGGPVDVKRIFVVPCQQIKKYDNPRLEPEELYAEGYVLIGDPDVTEPDQANGRFVSLMHMALSENLQRVEHFVKLVHQHCTVDRDTDPSAPQTIPELAEDIRIYGQLEPVLLRQGGREMVDGGRRTCAILLNHAESKLKIEKGAADAPDKVFPAVVQATDVKCSDDELLEIASKINTSTKGYTELQEGRVYHLLLQQTNPETLKVNPRTGEPGKLYDKKRPNGRLYTRAEVARKFHVGLGTFVNREALWHPFNARTGKGLTDEERRKVSQGKLMVTFAARKSLGQRHYSDTGTPSETKAKPLPLKEIQRLFDETAEDNVVRRQAIADCMGIPLKQAVTESERRIADKERIQASGRKPHQKAAAD